MMARLLVMAVLATSPLGGKWTNVNVLAWTRDGHQVVCRTGEPDEDGATQWDAVVVLEVRTRVARTFTTEPGGAQLNLADVEKGKDPADAALRGWLRRHPWVKAKASRTSPDGRSQVEIRLSPQALAGTWSDGRWTADGSMAWTLSVSRGGKMLRAGSIGRGASARVFWSPDGRRTAWIICHQPRSPRDNEFCELALGTDGSPSVSVSVPRPGSKEAMRVVSAVERAGFAVIGVTPARTPRRTSVVYAVPGKERVARKLAAALAGGAEVQPLTWSSDSDLVLAPGPTAWR